MAIIGSHCNLKIIREKMNFILQIGPWTGFGNVFLDLQDPVKVQYITREMTLWFSIQYITGTMIL